MSSYLKSRRARILWAGVITLASALALWAWLEIHRTGDEQIRTSTVTVGPIVRRVVATGGIQPLTTVQVGAQVSGTLESVDVDYNSIVRAGQVIARLDSSAFEAAVREAQAALGAARASEEQARANQAGLQTAVEDAKTQLRRAEELAAGQLIPDADLDAARAAVDEAQAALQSGESQIAEARASVIQAGARLTQARVDLQKAHGFCIKTRNRLLGSGSAAIRH